MSKYVTTKLCDACSEYQCSLGNGNKGERLTKPKTLEERLQCFLGASDEKVLNDVALFLFRGLSSQPSWLLHPLLWVCLLLGASHSAEKYCEILQCGVGSDFL